MTDGGEFDVARALAQAARSMAVRGNPDDTLDAIVVAARTAVPGFDEVSATVVAADGVVTTVASTNVLVRDLDSLQYKLGEGPCLSAVLDQEPVLAQRLSQEQRWPRYTPRAVEAGIRSQLAVHLAADEETLGSLNFYSTVRDTIHPEAFHRASLFATHAALALGHARRLEATHASARTHRLIGQAIGMLVERFEIDDERSFYYLVRVASAGGLELRQVAREVVDQGNRRAASG
jgi:transcriptional regulator with GAF, ATPase, and Fis domain